MKNNKKIKYKNRFRCQYQKGDTCISQNFNSNNPISAPDIILTLSKLAVKVKEEINSEVGGRVALQVLKIHEYFIKTVNLQKHGNRKNKSYYFDPKAKNKTDRSERVDLEILGDYGLDNKTLTLSTYIKRYRQIKGWE